MISAATDASLRIWRLESGEKDQDFLHRRFENDLEQYQKERMENASSRGNTSASMRSESTDSSQGSSRSKLTSGSGRSKSARDNRSTSDEGDALSADRWDEAEGEEGEEDEEWQEDKAILEFHGSAVNAVVIFPKTRSPMVLEEERLEELREFEDEIKPKEKKKKKKVSASFAFLFNVSHPIM